MVMIEQYKMLYAQRTNPNGGDKKVYNASISVESNEPNEPNEDTQLLPGSEINGFISLQREISFDIDKYDEKYIKNSHRWHVFEKSQHVRHYQMYPKIYQKEVNRFMDFCLKINRNNGSNLKDQNLNL